MIIRITKLYSLLSKNVYPWQWDYDNYSGPNEDMIGIFYPEDVEAIRQIQYFESKYEPPKK